MPDAKQPLSEYHAKRSLDRTPEPGGGTLSSAGNLFVVQKHAATRTHYDFRLELDGVLKSWAVPKTPSYDQSVKRVAIHVEDHPLEYARFEGVIPEGNYGAGPVIVWDTGVWVPLKDPREGLEEGKLLFELRGHKLRGRWTLVKMKKTEKEWLLIKERDGLETSEGEDKALPEESVMSGLTVEQVGEGYDPAGPILEALDELDAPAGDLDATSVEPMLAEAVDDPFSDPDWVFELKYDGYRIMAGLDDGEARLISRNGNDLTASFPEVRRALEALPFERLVLDGEVVVHDPRGVPSFQRLQKRARLSNPLDVDRAALELPATLYVFDALGFHGRDLRGLGLLERKDILRRVLPPVGPLRYSDHIPEKGAEMFERVAAMNLEGIVGKRADSPYRSGRSDDWRKIRADLTDDFAVVGWTEPKGGRSGFGALHLGAWDDDTLVYAGRVGSGFSQAQLDEVSAELAEHEVAEPPAEGAPDGDEHHWVSTSLVVEVRYKEWTDDGNLRQPVFLRFRDDKAPSECIKRVPVATLDIHVDEPEEERREVRRTNTDKVFWPDAGFTKGDLIDYYEAIGPWILPYLRDRPLVLTRYPDGIDGKSFYQKDAPDWAPDWLRTVTLWSEGSERELSYIVADNVETLVWVANSGAIPLHVWHSRVADLQKPDWCVIDLDPKEAPFEHVIQVALALHALCDEIGLPHFAKTSGSSGLHVLVPLHRQFTHEQARILGHLLAQVIVAENDEIATLHRVIDRREGKVYLDYLQNGHGKLIAAPFSARPKPGAPVSMPLAWDEVKPGLQILDFTLASAVARMEELDDDPLRPILDVKPDLLGALERLQERLG